MARCPEIKGKVWDKHAFHTDWHRPLIVQVRRLREQRPSLPAFSISVKWDHKQNFTQSRYSRSQGIRMRAKHPAHPSPQQKGTSFRSNFDLYLIPDQDLFFKDYKVVFVLCWLLWRLGSNCSVIVKNIILPLLHDSLTASSWLGERFTAWMRPLVTWPSKPGVPERLCM